MSGADLGGGCRGCAPLPEMTCGFLIQLVFCKKKKTMWFIGVEVEQDTSAPPRKKNPGSTPECSHFITKILLTRTHSDSFVLHVPTKTRHFIRPKS